MEGGAMKKRIKMTAIFIFTLFLCGITTMLIHSEANAFTYTMCDDAVHLYPFDGNVMDNKGTADGSISASIDFLPGLIDQAMNIDGSYEEMTAPLLELPALISGGVDWTFSGCFAGTVGVNGQTDLFNFGPNPGDDYLIARLHGTDIDTWIGLFIKQYDSSWGYHQIQINGANLADGPHCYAVVFKDFDQPSRVVEVYLDGVLKTAQAVDPVASILDFTPLAYIGRWYSSVGSLLHDEYIFWDRALSAIEISDLHSENLSGKSTCVESPCPEGSEACNRIVAIGGEQTELLVSQNNRSINLIIPADALPTGVTANVEVAMYPPEEIIDLPSENRVCGVGRSISYGNVEVTTDVDFINKATLEFTVSDDPVRAASLTDGQQESLSVFKLNEESQLYDPVREPVQVETLDGAYRVSLQTQSFSDFALMVGEDADADGLLSLFDSNFNCDISDDPIDPKPAISQLDMLQDQEARLILNPDMVSTYETDLENRSSHIRVKDDLSSITTDSVAKIFGKTGGEAYTGTSLDIDARAIQINASADTNFADTVSLSTDYIRILGRVDPRLVEYNSIYLEDGPQAKTQSGNEIVITALQQKIAGTHRTGSQVMIGKQIASKPTAELLVRNKVVMRTYADNPGDDCINFRGAVGSAEGFAPDIIMKSGFVVFEPTVKTWGKSARIGRPDGTVILDGNWNAEEIIVEGNYYKRPSFKSSGNVIFNGTELPSEPALPAACDASWMK